MPKFSKIIYKILSSHIASLNSENNIKSQIFSSIEGLYYDFIENKINEENFVKNIAMNIYEFISSIEFHIDEYTTFKKAV